jgi:hypothetical protein
MFGGQYRDDEVKWAEPVGERETERSRKAREQSTKRATAQTRVCLGKQKTETKRS